MQKIIFLLLGCILWNTPLMGCQKVDLNPEGKEYGEGLYEDFSIEPGIQVALYSP